MIKIVFIPFFNQYSIQIECFGWDNTKYFNKVYFIKRQYFRKKKMI